MRNSSDGHGNPDAEGNAPKKKILIIDDDMVHLEIAVEVLQGEQFEVIAHNDGTSVIDRVKALQPDLVLLDFHMPGVCGDGVAAQFRTEPTISHIPLVFYSAYDEDSLRKIASTAGAQGYICKWNIGDLQKKIKQYLHMPLSGDD
jgi:CheY-like chemotaxis protein